LQKFISIADNGEKMGNLCKVLVPDALPVVSQQESLAGPHPFSNKGESQPGQWASLPVRRLSDASTKENQGGNQLSQVLNPTKQFCTGEGASSG